MIDLLKMIVTAAFGSGILLVEWCLGAWWRGPLVLAVALIVAAWMFLRAQRWAEKAR